MSDLEDIKVYQDVMLNSFKSYYEDFRQVPKWGGKQTKELNNLLTDAELYDTATLQEFYDILKQKQLPNLEWKYCVQRWFSVRISREDEKLFYMNEGVEQNINKKGDWDVSIHGVEVDVKSTLYPRECLGADGKIPQNYATPEATKKLINYYYESQSKSREKYNSRLFVVHHSDFGDDRSYMMKLAFANKQKPISTFCSIIDTDLGWCKWSDEHENSVSQVIYFIETEKGKLNSNHFVKFK